MTQSLESVNPAAPEAAHANIDATAYWPSKDSQEADHGPPGQKAGQTTPDSSHSDHVPALELIDHGHPMDATAAKGATETAENHPGFFTEVGNVGTALWEGAKDEVENHSDQLAGIAIKSVIEGAVVGGIATLAVGAGTISAPMIVAAAIGMGATYVGEIAFEALVNGDTIIKNTSIVADPAAYSAQEVADARRTVEKAGGDGLKTVVRVAAGAAGGYGANVGINYAFNGETADEAGSQLATGARRVTDWLKPIPLLPLLTGVDNVFWDVVRE